MRTALTSEERLREARSQMALLEEMICQEQCTWRVVVALADFVELQKIEAARLAVQAQIKELAKKLQRFIQCLIARILGCRNAVWRTQNQPTSLFTRRYQLGALNA